MGVYYSRAHSYSRSYNAFQAEAQGRFPITRACQVLGLSLAAFRAGCRALKYVPREWHHVGKYANRVDYYDTEYLQEQRNFWLGAATSRNQAIIKAALQALEAREKEPELLIKYI